MVLFQPDNLGTHEFVMPCLILGIPQGRQHVVDSRHDKEQEEGAVDEAPHERPQHAYRLSAAHIPDSNA